MGNRTSANDLNAEVVMGGNVAWAALARGRLRGNHVIQLTPLRRRHTSPIDAGSALSLAGAIGRAAPLAHPAIPDYLHAWIIRECAGQQLERGEVATSHDDESWTVHDWLADLPAPYSLGAIPVLVDDRPQRLVDQLAALQE